MDMASFPSMTKTTWSTWVKLSAYTSTSADGYPMMIAATPLHELRFFGNTGRPEVIFNYPNAGWGTVAATNAISLNEWHNIAITYDGTTIILYVDGVNSGSVASTFTAPTAFNIGRRYDDIYHLNGLIAENRIYNRSFSIT